MPTLFTDVSDSMLLQDHSKTAIALPEGSISYRQLLQAAHGFASLFAKKKQRVLILAENRPEWMYAAYAAWINEATIVPVDYLATVEEILYITRDCAPAVFFCSQQTRPVLEQVIERLDYSPQLLVFEDLPDHDRLSAAPINLADDQATALIIYTSGTTGSPKGVMLSFANILTNIAAVSTGVPIYNREERVMVLLPLHHIFPLLGTMVAPLSVGATTVLCPSPESGAILHTLQQHAVTIIIGVPRLYKLMITGIMARIQASPAARLFLKIAEKSQSPVLSRVLFRTVHQKFGGNIKFLVSGGAALDPEVGRQFTTLGFTVLEGYGMTETAPMISFTRPGKVTIGSAGTAMPCTRIDIRNGEIVVSGENVMQGYWQRPQETAEVLRDGWLYTGDLGHLDDRGRLFITGRKKEILILPNGKNINPILLEQQLEGATDFASEVAVFLHKDILQAVIRPDLPAMRSSSITDIEDYFRQKVIEPFNRSVSPAKRVMKFSLVTDELPKTRLSKLKRFELPDLVARTQVYKKHAEQPACEEYRLIKEFIQEQTDQEIHPDDHLEIDIALDSLDKVSLLAFLKSTFGIDIGEDKLMTHQTVRKLSIFVRDKKEKISVELVNWKEILKEKVELNLPGTWFTTPLIKNVTKGFFSVYFKFTGEGREYLPDTPCIIAPNHQSFFDGLFIAAVLKDAFVRNTYFYAKEKHVQNKWVRSFASRNNIIVMDRNNDLKESIQKLAALLRNGKNIMIFPEGTRSIDGALGEFKRTFAILSKELNVPVVPVTINGAYEALPTGSLFPKPFKKISVNFQKPIFPEDHTYETLRQQVIQKVREQLKR